VKEDRRWHCSNGFAGTTGWRGSTTRAPGPRTARPEGAALARQQGGHLRAGSPPVQPSQAQARRAPVFRGRVPPRTKRFGGLVLLGVGHIEPGPLLLGHRGLPRPTVDTAAAGRMTLHVFGPLADSSSSSSTPAPGLAAKARSRPTRTTQRDGTARITTRGRRMRAAATRQVRSPQPSGCRGRRCTATFSHPLTHSGINSTRRRSH